MAAKLALYRVVALEAELIRAKQIATTHYMDEAARCTDIGIIHGGQLIAKGSPLTLKEGLHRKLLEIHVQEVMDGMQILRGLPDVYGVELRSGRLRIYARDSEALLDSWLKRWPFENLRWLGYSWVEPDMEDVFMAYSTPKTDLDNLDELKVHPKQA